MSVTADREAYARLARDGVLNYGGQLLAAVIGLAMVPVLLDQLGAERYGVLVVAITCALLAAFLDLGLGSAVTRDVAVGDLDGARFVRSAGPAFLVVGAGGAVALAALGAVVDASGFAAGVGEVPVVFALIGIAFCGDQLTVYCTAVLGGMRRFDVVSVLLVAMVAVRAAATLGVLAADGGAAAVAACYAATAWLFAGVNALAVRALAPEHALRMTRLDRRALRSRLSFGTGSLAIMVSLGALWNAGPLIVAAVSGAAASALFSVSQRFPMGALALPERMSVVLFPAAGEAGASPAWLIARGTRLSLLALTPVAIVLLIGADAILSAWLDDVPEDGPLVLRLTTVAVLAYGLCAGAVQVLWATGEVRRLAAGLAASALLATAGGAVLAAALGPAGAAGGLLAGAAAASAWTLRLSASATGDRVRDLVGDAVRGLAGPAAACAVVAGGLMALPLDDGWPRVLIVAAGALIGYVSAMLSRDSVRAVARRFPRLRSAGYFLLDLRAAALDTPRRNRKGAVAPYEAAPDPWGYETAWGPRHLGLTERLLDTLTGAAPCGSAIDVGCGEGWVTERLSPRCADVLAVDISATALERARERCAHAANVRFRRWDLLRDEPLGEFDLVLAMGVFEVFRRPSTMRRARRRILDMTAPGGHLLVTTTKQSPVIERSRWSGGLVRGGPAIDRFLRESGQLRRRATEESPTHVLTLYERLGAR